MSTGNSGGQERVSGLGWMTGVFFLSVILSGLIGALVHALFFKAAWVVYGFLGAGMILGLLLCLQICFNEIKSLREELRQFKILEALTRELYPKVGR